MTANAVAGDAPSGYLPFEKEAVADDGVAIAIDLGAANIRVAMWDAEAGRGIPVSFIQSEFGHDLPPEAMPSVVAYPTSSKTIVGQPALATSTGVPLIGVQRLLGRGYASLGGAKWLSREADEFIGAALVPEDGDDTHGGVRLKMTFDRQKPSGLKKRGGAAEVRAGGEGKARSTTIDQLRAPEEVVYKLLQAAKEFVEKEYDVEVTHCALVVPSSWGLAQRRGAFDAAILAGLTPLAVLPQPVALLAGWNPPPKHAHTLVVDWGAGACVGTLMRAGAVDATAGRAPHQIVGVRAVDEAGGLSLDRLIAAVLHERLAGAMDTAGVDPSSAKTRVALLVLAEKLKVGLFEYGEQSECSEPLKLDGPEGRVELPVALTRSDWERIVSQPLAAVESMVAELLTAGGVAVDAPIVVHVSGGQAACGPAWSAVQRAIGEKRATVIRTDAGEMDSSDGEADGAYAAACGAAMIAAHRMQPQAVEAAWKVASGQAWQGAPADFLPLAVSIEGTDGTATTLFAAGSGVGQTTKLFVNQSDAEQHVRIVEGNNTSGGAVPLLDLTVPALRRRRPSIFGGGKKDAAEGDGPPQRAITVQLLPSGVLDADVDDDDDDDDDESGGGLGVCGKLLLLLLLVSSVIGIVQQLQHAPVLEADATVPGGAGTGEGEPAQAE